MEISIIQRLFKEDENGMNILTGEGKALTSMSEIVSMMIFLKLPFNQICDLFEKLLKHFFQEFNHKNTIRYLIRDLEK